MEFSLYHLLTQHLTSPPDLSIVKQGQLLPEEWPVVLEKIVTYRKQVQSFTVTDGKSRLTCLSEAPDLYNQIAGTELGAILHLLGSRTVFSQPHHGYVLYIEAFMTLKQYDEHLREIREAEALRLANLHDAMVAYHSGYAE